MGLKSEDGDAAIDPVEVAGATVDAAGDDPGPASEILPNLTYPAILGYPIGRCAIMLVRGSFWMLLKLVSTVVPVYLI